MTTITTTAPTEQQLNAVAVDRIIERAKGLLSDPEYANRWHLYELAKEVIEVFTTSADEYESAIARLSEALGI